MRSIHSPQAYLLNSSRCDEKESGGTRRKRTGRKNVGYSTKSKYKEIGLDLRKPTEKGGNTLPIF